MQHSNCGWCGTTFVKKNRLHKFCSSSCKKKSWRKQNGKSEYPTFITKSKPLEPVKTQPIEEPLEVTMERARRMLMNTESKPIAKKTTIRTVEPVQQIIDQLNKESQGKEKEVIRTPKNRYLNKFDSMLDEIIKNERFRLDDSNIYSKKSANKKIKKEWENNRPAIHKALERIEKQLSKKEKQMNKVSKIVRKSKTEISAIIANKRIEYHKELTRYIKDGNFGLVKVLAKYW